MNKPVFVSTPNEPDEFTQVFLHHLRHDLFNTVRPLVEIPKWIVEDFSDNSLDLPASLSENLDMMNVYGLRLSQMITDLLTYAHIGQLPEEEPLSLSKIVEGLVQGTLPDEFQLTTDFQGTELPISTPNLRILIDALLSNCVKHHDRSLGRIHIACREINQGIQLTISDDGPGINPRFLERIFDPLTTLESRDVVEGSGMGLTIVRRIVKLSGGNVKAVSADGKRGTCIAVWFP
jgi:signal transduction histidine kinase